MIPSLEKLEYAVRQSRVTYIIVNLLLANLEDTASDMNKSRIDVKCIRSIFGAINYSKNMTEDSALKYSTLIYFLTV